MNARAKDINLLKIALLPVFILATIVLTLSILATTISNAVVADTATAMQTASPSATMVARNTTDHGLGSGS